MAIWNTGHRQHLHREHSVAMVSDGPVFCPGEKPMSIRAAIARAFLLLFLAVFATGCNDNSKHEGQMNTINNDLGRLEQLMNLPAGVKRSEWQTGSFASRANDWWLAAVLEVEPQKIPEFLQGTGVKEVFETLPGMELTSFFAALTSFAGAQAIQPNQIRLITDTYGAEPYLKSPLLNGKAIRLSENKILVVLWTN